MQRAIQFGFDQNPYIETASGAFLYASNPVFKPEDIAHSLSHVCRFAGHCRVFYSVAEHSLLVAEIMRFFEWGDPFEGLLHDASESAIADIATPFKNFLSDYHRFERILETRMRAQFNLPDTITLECKLADTIALALEAEALIPSKGTGWPMFTDSVLYYAQDFKADCGPTFGITGIETVRFAWLNEFNNYWEARK